MFFIMLAILRDDCSLAIIDIVLEACMLLIYHFNVFYILHHTLLSLSEKQNDYQLYFDHVHYADDCKTWARMAMPLRSFSS